MTASVQLVELNGVAPGTPTDKSASTLRFKQADNATVDLVNPLTVPTTNTLFSYQKVLRARIQGGSFTQVSNLAGYFDGAEGFQSGSPAAVKLWAAAYPAYIAPAQPSATIDPPQYPASGSPSTNMVNAFTYTSAAPIDLDGFNVGPFTNGSPIEYIGDFLIFVMEVEIGAANGLLTGETFTLTWDEI